jgi:crotonobetainyl-CoA:carnitine CoA-transferase CaiB-like acyl-CoA transferase
MTTVDSARGRRGPLAGVKVLDLTLAMAGPLATARMGDLGAEVIKVESPSGDFARHWPINGYMHGDESSAYLMLNRNKRSIVLDLKNEAARTVFLDLVRQADILVQNFRPRVAKKLGIDYETLAAVRPELVYVSISGYGDEGPMVDRPGQDLLVQSFSGLTFNGGTADGLPHPSPVYMVDTCASHHATEAALAGYVERLRTGRGQHLKVSLLAAALEIQIQELSVFMTSGRDAIRCKTPFASTWMEAPYGIYRTADSFIAVAQARLPDLAEAFGDPRILEAHENQPPHEDVEARRAFRDRIGALVQEAFLRKTTAQWIEELTARDIWVGPVNTYADVVAHPQMQNLFATIDHPAGPYRTLAPAIRCAETSPMTKSPALGEHTDEILAELGVAPDGIRSLREAGAVR